MRQARAIAVMVLGMGLLALTVWVTVVGIGHPSTRSAVAIALLGSIGVPVGLGAINTGWRRRRGPNALDLREEAEAKRRTAAALDDAEVAERIKIEMEAYVELRAKRLEIARRRDELAHAARTLVERHQELNDAEVQIGLATSKLDPATLESLGHLLKPRSKVSMQSAVFDLMPLPDGIFRIVEAGVEWILRGLERRRLQRLTQLAPAALVDREGASPTIPGMHAEGPMGV